MSANKESSKMRAYVTIFFVIAAFVVIYFITQPRSEITLKDYEHSAITIAGTTVSVEIPLTKNSYKKGLGDRDELGEKSGILFLCLTDPYPKFWMKGMKFPIDIIWIDENFVVSDITRDVSVDSFPEYFMPSQQSEHVLEVNAGFIEEHSISIGDRVYGLGGTPCALTLK